MTYDLIILLSNTKTDVGYNDLPPTYSVIKHKQTNAMI